MFDAQIFIFQKMFFFLFIFFFGKYNYYSRLLKYMLVCMETGRY